MIRFLALIAVLVSCVVVAVPSAQASQLLGGAGGRSSCGAGSTSATRLPGCYLQQGNYIHICTFAHFDVVNNRCRQDDSSISPSDTIAVIVFPKSAVDGAKELLLRKKYPSGNWETVASEELRVIKEKEDGFTNLEGGIKVTEKSASESFLNLEYYMNDPLLDPFRDPGGSPFFEENCGPILFEVTDVHKTVLGTRIVNFPCSD